MNIDEKAEIPDMAITTWPDTTLISRKTVTARHLRRLRAAARRRPDPGPQGVAVGRQIRHRDPDRPRALDPRLDRGDQPRDPVWVERAAIDVAERHPTGRGHPVQLENPAHEIDVRLPKRFFALTEELVNQGDIAKCCVMCDRW